MRRVILLLTSITVLVAVAPTVQAQRTAHAKWCLQGRSWGFPGNCQFATREQCMATASGTNSTCGVNPHWAFAQQRRHRR